MAAPAALLLPLALRANWEVFSWPRCNLAKSLSPLYVALNGLQLD